MRVASLVDRGILVSVGPLLLAAAIVGFAACDAPPLFVPPAEKAAIPSGATVTAPWMMAKISLDQRRLDVGVYHPEIPPRGCRDFTPVASVDERPDRVTLTIAATATTGHRDRRSPSACCPD